MSVEQSHIIDDLCKELGTLRREVTKSLRLLELAAHAHYSGRAEVVEEYIGRAMEHLRKGVG